jgi:hypothetical protein
MSVKLLDTFVRISRSTRAQMKKHCERFDLQQGRFADSAILTAIQQWDGNGRPAGGNGHAAPKRKAAK